MSDEEYKELSNYAWLEGTEIGTYLAELLCVRENSESHGMGAEFSIALDKELNHWLERFRAETVIEKTLEPQPDIEVETLVWLDEGK